MKKNLLIILLLSVCAFVPSCSDETYFKIGTDWVDKNLQLVYIDSCVARLSTVRVDSTPTYGQGVILAGKYTDVNTLTGEQLTGTTKAISYLEISRPSAVADPGNNAIFDSLVIEMRFNGYYMGDTVNNNMHLFVHQLEERMKLDVVVGMEVYYNTTSFRYSPVPLAETTFPIRPHNTAWGISTDAGIFIEPVRVRLPDSMGQEMLDKIVNKDEEFETNEKFLDYFKGLVFVAGDDVETVVGFKTDSTFKINLHYHIQEEFKTEHVITFSINTTNQFNNIRSDRNGTGLLPDLFTDNEIESFRTGNQSFIAAGDGLYTKIEFPNLNSILMTSAYGIVESAILEIKPVYGTYHENTPLPAHLVIAASDIADESELALTDMNGQSQTGNLIIDPQYWANTRYSFDITAFVQDQMSAPASQKLYLTVKLPSDEMRNSTKRLVIGDSNHSIENGDAIYNNQIKLYLYYNMYNEKN
jgi:hypothetical protein